MGLLIWEGPSKWADNPVNFLFKARILSTPCLTREHSYYAWTQPDKRNSQFVSKIWKLVSHSLHLAYNHLSPSLYKGVVKFRAFNNFFKKNHISGFPHKIVRLINTGSPFLHGNTYRALQVCHSLDHSLFLDTWSDSVMYITFLCSVADVMLEKAWGALGYSIRQFS